MPLTVMQKTRDRLSRTEEGLALLKLIDEYETPMKLAEKLGFDEQQVRQWIYKGKMSKRGAVQIEESTGRKKIELRPDVCAAGWTVRQQGPVPKKPPIASTPDAKLLVKLAEQFGSVKDLCAAAFISVSDYHTYKSRGRIPAIKLPTLAGLLK